MPIPKPSNQVHFSFLYTLLKCVNIKNKHFSFTNQVPPEEIKDYRTILEKAWQDYSGKTIEQLRQDQVCYLVKKDKINETRNNIAKVFQAIDYPTEWIEQNIQDSDVYKFKITKQIRMFGIVERNNIYVLLYDLWHQINQDRKKNFPIPTKKIKCTWCLKSCDKKKK